MGNSNKVTGPIFFYFMANNAGAQVKAINTSLLS